MIYTYSDGRQAATCISVNGTALPPPSEMTVSREDLHGNTERNAAGYLVADLIRSNVLKISLSWAYLAQGDLTRIIAALGTAMWKTVVYHDERTNANSTATMYKGAMQYLPNRILSTGKIDGYRSVTVNLIEK